MLNSTSCVECNVTTTTSCCALQQYVSELKLTPGTMLVPTSRTNLTVGFALFSPCFLANACNQGVACCG